MKRILSGGLILLLIVGTGLPAFPQFTATTIANIQNELYSPGTQLEITGIVSAIHPVPVPSYVYVQDAAAVRSGIRCYGGGGTVTGINMGDEVTVQGVYDDPFGETQLNFSATVIGEAVSHGNEKADAGRVDHFRSGKINGDFLSATVDDLQKFLFQCLTL